jgi:hypothetical protein
VLTGAIRKQAWFAPRHTVPEDARRPAGPAKATQASQLSWCAARTRRHIAGMAGDIAGIAGARSGMGPRLSRG